MNKDELQEIKALIHSWAYPIIGDNDRLIEVSIFQELIAAVEELQAENERLQTENKNYREIYYSEHCPHCDEPTYPIMINVKFSCPKCKRTFDWKPLWERNEPQSPEVI